MLIYHLRQAGTRVNLTWVKAHVGIEGNERADCLAKQATALPVNETKALPLPPSHIKMHYSKLLHQRWQLQWDEDDTGRLLYEYLPKVKRDRLFGSPAVNAFLTGHGPFLSYLERFRILNSSQCSCGEEGTAIHYLCYCPLTQELHVRPHRPGQGSIWAEQLNSKPLTRKIAALIRWLGENQENLIAP